jgi:hypothetical protein
VGKAVLGIALTGVAVGFCWLAVGISLAVPMCRAIRVADEREARTGEPAEPQIEVPDDLSSLMPLLGVVGPREPDPAA